MKRKILKFIFIGLLSILGLLSGMYFYFKLTFNQYVDINTFNIYINEIKKSESLPPKIYTKFIKSKQIESDYLESVMFNDKPAISRHVAFVISPHITHIKNNRLLYFIHHYFIIEKIESQTSQKECLNWVFNNFDFLYNNKGIRQASLFYFQKDISQLNDDEIKQILKMFENPVKYNPLRNY